MSNKRNFVRYVIEAKVRFESVGDLSKSIEGRVLDIGSLGWGAFFKEKIDLNTVIKFDLTANFMKEHLQGIGKIVNIQEEKSSEARGFRVGVEFIDVDNDMVLRFISEEQRIARQQREKDIEMFRNKQRREGMDMGPF